MQSQYPFEINKSSLSFLGGGDRFGGDNRGDDISNGGNRHLTARELFMRWMGWAGLVPMGIVGYLPKLVGAHGHQMSSAMIPTSQSGFPWVLTKALKKVWCQTMCGTGMLFR